MQIIIVVLLINLIRSTHLAGAYHRNLRIIREQRLLQVVAVGAVADANTAVLCLTQLALCRQGLNNNFKGKGKVTRQVR